MCVYFVFVQRYDAFAYYTIVAYRYYSFIHPSDSSNAYTGIHLTYLVSLYIFTQVEVIRVETQIKTQIKTKIKTKIKTGDYDL